MNLQLVSLYCYEHVFHSLQKKGKKQWVTKLGLRSNACLAVECNF